MGRIKYSPEKIISMLREAEVKLGQGIKTGQVCRDLGEIIRKSGTRSTDSSIWDCPFRIS